VTGESFSYLGRNYRLRLIEQQREPLRFDGHAFLLRRDARGAAERHFSGWYRRQGLSWLEVRVSRLAPRIGATPSKVVVRNLSNRWGSCGRNRTVAFHWKLLQLPVGLIDYVVIHEIAHLIENHHGPGFWGCVERALPDWRERKEQLDRLASRYLRIADGKVDVSTRHR
jgi:hypothetical protein